MKDFTAAALNDVMDERARQDAKWGQQDHEAARWLMILGEEYGEACEAGCRLTWPSKIEPPENQEPYRVMCREDFRKELVQVAAVAVAMIEAIDRADEPNAPHQARAGSASPEAGCSAPHIFVERVVVDRRYNPEYGDDRVCVCGHKYYRHFDTYEGMKAVGCKYCECAEFVEPNGKAEG